MRPTSRILSVLGACMMVAASSCGMAILSTSAAGADPTTVTTTVDDPMAGPIPLLNTPEAFDLSDTVTLPTAAAPGGSITLGQTLTWTVTPGACPIGLPETDSFTSFTSTVDVAGASPSSSTSSAVGLPISYTGYCGFSVTVPMTPLTFTAGTAGTATITQDAITAGGTFSGVAETLDMTAGWTPDPNNVASCGTSCPSTQPAATLGTVPITASGTDMPVGSLGAVGLAGFGGLGLVVAQRRRSRRFRRATE